MTPTNYANDTTTAWPYGGASNQTWEGDWGTSAQRQFIPFVSAYTQPVEPSVSWGSRAWHRLRLAGVRRPESLEVRPAPCSNVSTASLAPRRGCSRLGVPHRRVPLVALRKAVLR